ncbi:LOW QUALITY PROTEIN: polymeric immunoglobulin receptor-like [Hypanus sabinus]|uniref:LOW QUALITY PROTEIN: polymeric immunoglobulin receptor-like n=1 Tax=Hypanus sabinus TaxID=79690 RepID=UPI0028C4D3A0|nr:LOW QUALITY PROTEIN: polymeric immunoglobulin receptor-like [Hypanus sabinus]
MWIPILLICSLPVSGALWAEKYVRGVVGRAITIDCQYEAKYRSYTKYWCNGWTHQCSVLVETKGQHRRRGRMSITDNPERGIFTVTMEDLHSGDKGWYCCGIITPSRQLRFSVHLEVSDVSGTLRAEKHVTGVVISAIAINCHYEAKYRSHTKYWCHGWTRHHSVLVETNEQRGRSGRVSITDNPERGIFTVTMHDLSSGDTGWYSCGITSTDHPMFDVHLQVSEEPVSVPVLRYLSPANVSRLRGSLSVSCESLQRSLPIQYTWIKKNSSEDQKISDTDELVLPGQSLNLQAHSYYCRALNRLGIKSSGMLHDMGSGTLAVLCSAGHLDYRCHMVRERQNVSGALWAEKYVKGVVGRAITIDCHYRAKYRWHAKYWCHGWTISCSVMVETKGQHGRSGRVSITDKSVQGIFTVTMEVLHSGDTGWYSCGITTRDSDPMFNVHLQVSNEPPSVPRLLFSPPTNGSSCVDSVSVSCKSVHGSLPIQYSWYEKTPSVDSSISDTNKLDLHCESLKYNHLYYCKASNAIGENSSKMVNVSISNSVSTCRYVIEVNGMGPIYICEKTVKESMTTEQSEESSSDKIYVIWKVGRWLFFALLGIWTIAVTWFTRDKKRHDQSDPHSLVHEIK